MVVNRDGHLTKSCSSLPHVHTALGVLRFLLPTQAFFYEKSLERALRLTVPGEPCTALVTILLDTAFAVVSTAFS